MRKEFTIILILIFILGLMPTNFSSAQDLSDKLSGKILLQVEDAGQAWYVDPETKERAFLGRPTDAFKIMRELGLGISEDSYNLFNGYASSRLSGKILLRVEANGEAYYVSPDDLKMHYLGRPADAFDVMRKKGLGITDNDLNKVPIFEKYKEQVKENTDAIGGLEKKIEEQQNKIDELEEAINTDSCIADTWACGTWGNCSAESQQTRICNLISDCQNTSISSPITTQNCTLQATQEQVIITLGNITTNTNSVYVKWRTNLPTDSKIFLTLPDSSTRVIPSLSGNSTQHIVNIDDLLANTYYAFEIEAIANNSVVKKNSNFTTNAKIEMITRALPYTFSYGNGSPDCFDTLTPIQKDLPVGGVIFHSQTYNLYVDTIKFKLNGSAIYGVDYNNVRVEGNNGKKYPATHKDGYFIAQLSPEQESRTPKFIIDAMSSIDGKTITPVVEKSQDVTFKQINDDKIIFDYSTEASLSFPLISFKYLFIADMGHPFEYYPPLYCE